MNPQTLKRLKEIPEVSELIAFLASELHKIDSLDGLNKLDFKERAYEVGARLVAKERLTAMLTPLLEGADGFTGTDPAEYVV